MYRPRAAAERVLRLASQFPPVVISGARQVGKSTLLEHLFGGQAEIVAFDPIDDVGGV